MDAMSPHCSNGMVTVHLGCVKVTNRSTSSSSFIRISSNWTNVLTAREYRLACEECFLHLLAINLSYPSLSRSSRACPTPS